jgi:hypothetical protein
MSNKLFSVCCSNFDFDTKEEIKRGVVSLGGHFSEDMKKSTAVLLSNKINTKKCIVSIL